MPIWASTVKASVFIQIIFTDHSKATLLNMDFHMEQKRNTTSDSNSSKKLTRKSTRSTATQTTLSSLDTISSPLSLSSKEKNILERDKIFQTARRRLLNLMSLKSQLKVLIGDLKVQSTQSKTKASVDHAGLFHQLLLLKELISSKQVNC